MADRLTIEIDARTLSSVRQTFDQLQQQFRQMESQARTSTSRINSTMESVKSSLDRIANSAKWVGAALTAAVIGLGKAMSDAASQMQGIQQQFTTLTGSAERARQLIAEMEQLAASSVFDRGPLFQMASRFMAAGIAAEDVVDTIRILGDTVAATGQMSQERLERVSFAIAQIAAKGRVQMEEILQLQEAGIPALQQLQRALGLNQDQVAKIGKEGIGAGTALRALFQTWQKDFGGFMSQMMDTVPAQLSNLRDNFVRMLTEPGSVLNQELVPLLKELNKTLADIAASEEFKDFIRAFRDAVKEIVPHLRDIVGLLGKAVSLFASLPDPIQKTAVALGILAGPIALVASGLRSIWNAAKAAIGAIASLRSALAGIGSRIGAAGTGALGAVGALLLGAKRAEAPGLPPETLEQRMLSERIRLLRPFLGSAAPLVATQMEQWGWQTIPGAPLPKPPRTPGFGNLPEGSSGGGKARKPRRPSFPGTLPEFPAPTSLDVVQRAQIAFLRAQMGAVPPQEALQLLAQIRDLEMQIFNEKAMQIAMEDDENGLLATEYEREQRLIELAQEEKRLQEEIAREQERLAAEEQRRLELEREEMLAVLEEQIRRMEEQADLSRQLFLTRQRTAELQAETALIYARAEVERARQQIELLQIQGATREQLLQAERESLQMTVEALQKQRELLETQMQRLRTEIAGWQVLQQVFGLNRDIVELQKAQLQNQLAQLETATADIARQIELAQAKLQKKSPWVMWQEGLEKVQERFEDMLADVLAGTARISDVFKRTWDDIKRTFFRVVIQEVMNPFLSVVRSWAAQLGAQIASTLGVRLGMTQQGNLPPGSPAVFAPAGLPGWAGAGLVAAAVAPSLGLNPTGAGIGASIGMAAGGPIGALIGGVLGGLIGRGGGGPRPPAVSISPLTSAGLVVRNEISLRLDSREVGRAIVANRF